MKGPVLALIESPWLYLFILLYDTPINFLSSNSCALGNRTVNMSLDFCPLPLLPSYYMVLYRVEFVLLVKVIALEENSYFFLYPLAT